MTLIDKKAIDRVSDLIAKASSVLNTKYEGAYTGTYVNEANYVAYRAQAVACVVSIVGEDHAYAKTLNSGSLKTQHYVSTANAVKEILQALKEDLEKGHLQNLKEIVHSEIFTDFIEMAEHLLNQGYKDPAAVIIGSVLEEHLRKLCLKNGLTVTSPDKNGVQKPKKASQLNDELCKNQIYLSTHQKQVTAWLALRNEAAHGKYSSYQQSEIEGMITSVVSFLAQYPA
ncbi:MAG: hypothetical protein WC028_30250 [Candidatus Obscuribacterales bacterium]